MRWARRIAIAAVALLAVLFVMAYGIFLYISRPETILDRPPRPDYTACDLSSKIGWYQFAPDDVRLVTFGADGALRLFVFGDTTEATPLAPHSSTEFDWLRDEGRPPIHVAFVSDPDGAVSAIEWRNSDKQSQTARRRNDFGYRARELTYSSHDTPLVGTLFVPRGEGPFPAAVFIHGSGNSDRDNRWYMTMVHRLVSDGVVVLLPDKRGCGQSGGQWRTASFAMLADDVAAGVAELREQPEIDPRRVGLVGISQGGWIAPIVASEMPEIAYVVDVVGASVRVEEQLEHETYSTLAQSGVPAWLRPLLVPWAMDVPRRRRSQWWKVNGPFDPLPYWKATTQPVLVVYGGEDEGDNVPVAESVARLNALVEDGRDMTIEVYPDSGHALYEPGTRTIRQDFLDLLSSWILAKSAPQAPPATSPAD